MWTYLIFVGRREFFEGLGDKYVLDLQDFLHEKLPKLIFVALFSWALMWVVKMVADRILRAADRQSSGAGHYAQVRTLTTGSGSLFFWLCCRCFLCLGSILGRC